MGKILEVEAELERRGLLHDSVIERICWDSGDRCLSLHIGDLDANCVGFPEYRGRIDGRVIFREVQEFEVSTICMREKVRIFEANAQGAENIEMEFKISPGGSIRVTAGSIEIIEKG